MLKSYFVFGSNLAGIHGAGAAQTAYKHYGAEWGVGKGPTGNAYAIPTKDKNIKTLRLSSIEKHIEEFIDFAKEHPRDVFILTPIGTGYAGYKVGQIANIFRKYQLPQNILLTNSWLKRT